MTDLCTQQGAGCVPFGANTACPFYAAATPSPGRAPLWPVCSVIPTSPASGLCPGGGCHSARLETRLSSVRRRRILDRTRCDEPRPAWKSPVLQCSQRLALLSVSLAFTCDSFALPFSSQPPNKHSQLPPKCAKNLRTKTGLGRPRSLEPEALHGAVP